MVDFISGIFLIKGERGEKNSIDSRGHRRGACRPGRNDIFTVCGGNQGHADRRLLEPRGEIMRCADGLPLRRFLP